MLFSLKLLMSTGSTNFFVPYGFRDAPIRLIEAFSDAEDPVALLVASAQEHIPLDTAGRTAESSIPDPESRQPIDQIIEGLYQQKWYMHQIRYRRTFDAKAGLLGRCGESTLS